MSDFEARRKNVAKQALFKSRHPHYLDKYKRLFPKQEMWAPLDKTGCLRTFELCDPRDIDELPRVIGLMPIKTRPVWRRLWGLREVSQAKWAAWLRELASLGLEPKETSWKLGCETGVSFTLAHYLCKLRIKNIEDAINDIPRTTSWLKRCGRIHIPWLMRGVSIRHIRALMPDGTVQKLKPNKALALVLGKDKQGRTWFDNK